METNSYKRIKDMFSLVLDGANNYQDIKIGNYGNKKDYLLDVYNKVTEDNYPNKRKMSMALMQLGRTEFDGLVQETIFLNLYSYLTVIMQNINGIGISREAFLFKMNVTEADNKNCVARFRKRLQPERLTRLRQVATMGEVKCYIPTLLKAYKDIFFIPRQNTDIIDISPYYVDIFASLMFDTDEENKDKVFMSNIDDIKAHNLRNLSKDTVKCAESIYNHILDKVTEDNKLIELQFVEKLFGILTADEILKKEESTDDILKIAEVIYPLVEFGSMQLNKEIIKRANADNISAYESMIDNYIYPLCVHCLKWYLNDVITYLGCIQTKEREDFLIKLRTVCSGFIKYRPPLKVSVYDTINRLKRYKKIKIDDSLVLSVLKLLQGIPSDDFNPDICCYLQSTKNIRHNDYDDIANEKNALVYDCDFTDLTFPQESKMFIYEDDLKKSEESETRIKY